MSHFTTLRTRMTNRDALLGALKDMAFGVVEVHPTPQHLYGYLGDVRPEKAEIIMRRQYIGKASNDIGFRRQQDGSFKVIVSEYDRGVGYGPQWLNKLTQRYAYRVLQEHIKIQRYTVVKEDTQQDGSVRLLLRRFAA